MMDKYLTHLTDQMGHGIDNAASAITQAITYSANQAHIAFLHLWGVLIKQQLIMGYQELVTGILLLVGSILVVRLFRKAFTQVKSKNTWDNWDRYALLSVIALVGCYLSIWLFLTGIGDVISSAPHILNPEYYALQDSIQILNQIKQ